MRKHSSILSFLLVVILIGCHKENVVKTSTNIPLFIWGFSIEGFPISNDVLKKLESETRISAQLIQFYIQWPDSSAPLTSIHSTLDAIANQGAIPCITWEPMVKIKEIETMINYQQIVGGQYDAYLLHMANDIKAWNKPVIIRFAHEMNLERYHWGGPIEDFNKESPEHYIKMFRYIVNFFRKQNANQVLWVFCPNVESVPNQSWNTPSHYYPGHDYVDILGMDGYNWDISAKIAKDKKQSWVKPWASFKDIFENLYRELKKIAPYKPILVFETSSVNRKTISRKSLWLKHAIQTAKEWELIGMIWFQVNKEEDWRINQDEDYAYVSIIRSAINPLQDWLHRLIKDQQPASSHE